jgi:CHAD domain-containing protein
MARSPTSEIKAISAAELTKPPRAAAKLNAAMPCDTAFRIVARRVLKDLSASHDATCNGDPQALHQMRIALTHLRAAILFFSPMVDDPIREHLRDELKWLNGELGTLRDLDVAIGGIEAEKSELPLAISHQTWLKKRAEKHRLLSRSLRSARYRRLIERTSSWIEKGPWSTAKDKRALKRRAIPIGPYAAERLGEWEERLLRKSRKLHDLDARKRHQLRLLNKKLTYSIKSISELFGDKRLSKQKSAMKHLRRAQRSLGQLNDDVRGRELALALQREGLELPPRSTDAKREKRLLRMTETAYRKLAALQPWN